MKIPKIPTCVLGAVLMGLLATGIQNRAAEQFFPGVIRVDIYMDIPGTELSALRNADKFPGLPDEVVFVPYLEWQNMEAYAFGSIEDPPANIWDNYGVKITGLLIPNESANYVFYLAADDNSEFWLSTDESPANAEMIVSEPAWNAKRNWLGDGHPDPTLQGRSRFSDPVPLEAGNRYAFEGLMKEGGGDDHYSVTMVPEGTTPVSMNEAEGILGTLPIDRDQLGYMGLTERGFLIEPADQTTIAGEGVSFSAQAVDAGLGTEVPTGYQWFRNGTAIEGATGSTFSTGPLSATDDGAIFHATATFADAATVTSREATVTVQADTVPPQVTDIQVDPATPHTSLTVRFSEPVNQEDAATVANYTLSGGVTVQSVEATSLTEVVLTTTAIQRDTPYTLTLGNIRDFSGNVISPNTVDFQITFLFGTALYERWQFGTSPGTAVAWAELLESGDLDAPDVVALRDTFTAPRDVADQYGARVRTFFIPPTTGGYVFFMSTDDHGFLYLSTDSNPANKHIIAAEPEWGNANTWETGLGGHGVRDPFWPENRSDFYFDTEWPEGNTINLQAGQQYYMELIFREGGGGDGGEVTYILVEEEDPVNGTPTRMREDVIGWPTAIIGALPPEVTSVTPAAGSTVRSDSTFNFTIADRLTAVVPNSITLRVNGVDVTGEATITDTAGGATVQWVSTQTYEPGSAINVELTFSDDATPPHTETWTGSFVASPIAPGNFVIEAEDYNYDGGQHVAEASTMPYLGGAYEGLEGLHNVDYFRSDAVPDGNTYRTTEDPNVPLSSDLNSPDRGGWVVTSNHRIGWVGGGHWYNYTRTFPEGTYQVWAALSFDGTGPGQLAGRMDLVTAGATTENQTLEALGTFNAPGSGGWGQNNHVPMRDEAGNIAVVSMGGVQTIRYTSQSGDIDFFTFLPAEPNGDPGPGIRLSFNVVGDNLVLEWTGGGTLLSSETVDGTYTPVEGNPSSPAQIPLTGSQRFFQVRQ